MYNCAKDLKLTQHCKSTVVPWLRCCHVPLRDSTDCSPPGSSVHGGSPGKNTGVGRHFLLQGDLSDPGLEAPPPSPALAQGFFTAEQPGKPAIVP